MAHSIAFKLSLLAMLIVVLFAAFTVMGIFSPGMMTVQSVSEAGALCRQICENSCYTKGMQMNWNAEAFRVAGEKMLKSCFEITGGPCECK